MMKSVLLKVFHIIDIVTVAVADLSFRMAYTILLLLALSVDCASMVR